MEERDFEEEFWMRFQYGTLTKEDCSHFIERLYERYSRSILLFIYYKHNTYEDAQDLCQDVFITALAWLQNNIGKHKPKLFFHSKARCSIVTKAWLYSIAKNLMIDKLRKSKRQPEIMPIFYEDDEGNWMVMDIEDPSPGGNPVKLLERKEFIQKFIEGIQLLSKPLRQAIQLVALEGASLTEAANQLEISVLTLRQRLYRARDQIQKLNLSDIVTDYDDEWRIRVTTTRYTDVSFPNTVILGQKSPLTIQITIERRDELSEELTLRAPEDETQDIIIDVYVSAPSFDIEGEPSRSIRVPQQRDSDLEVFYLIPKELGDKEIKVVLFQNGRYLATVKLVTTVVESAEGRKT